MNGSFDQWLRDNMPDVSVDETRKEIQLAVLKERIRSRINERRRRRARFGAIALPVLALIVIFGSVVDLGSDGFDYEVFQHEAVDGDIFITGHRNDGFNLPGNPSEDTIRELSEQLAADEGIVTAVSGWDCGGKTYWTLERDYFIEGKRLRMSSGSVSPPSIPAKNLLQFVQEEWESVESEILSGSNESIGRHSVTLDGHTYETDVWLIESQKFGSIVYYHGKVVR